ncbi:MAG: DUF4347 domain-containing protein [Timaviella obliquedivisa GSE-PSE-MK23-08B]|nr:DUF4347 domain-containing protein [Timaviella obliquedivisa GSE-PSE-MK23-08B]
MSDVSRFTPTATEVLVVIDSGVADFQLLAESVVNGAALLVLDSQQDGIQQITEAQQRHKANTLHIISHGAPGCLHLGNTQLNLSNLNTYTEKLQSWFANTTQPQLLLYGCNVAAGDAGEEFITKFQYLTRAEIAASTTFVGSATQGGNWNLDFKTGEIAPALAFSTKLLETYAYTFVIESVQVGAEAYARGSFIQVGLRANGTFGASGAGIPTGWQPTRSGTGLMGFIADSGKDGWATFDGDFFTPGDPEEGFTLEVGGTTYSNNTSGSLAEVVGSITGVTNGVTVLGSPAAEINWSGSVAGVKVDRTFTVAEDGLFILMKTTLTNTSGSNITTPIYWMHNVDPDNNQSINGSFDTTNTIVSQPNGSTDLAQVTATQPDGSTLSLAAIDPQARVTYGGFSNRDASDGWNGVGFTATTSSSTTADQAVSLSYKIDSLAAGGSTTFFYAYNLAADSSFLASVLAAFSKPSTPDLLATSDTGILDTDNITSDNTPTFAGTVAPNVTVSVFAGTTLLGTTTADASGNWTLTATTIADGTYDITIKTTDGAGKLSPSSSPLSVTIDIVDPPSAPSSLDLIALSDDGTSSTDDITSDTTPTITGTADPNSTIELFDNGTSLGTTTSDGSGFWTFTPSVSLAPGTHPITAIVTDTAGNASPVSTSLLITIVATPTVPFNLDLVTPSDTGVSTSDDLTANNTPTIVGKADPGIEVSLFDNGILIGTATTDGNGDWSFTPSTPLSEGAHPITVKAKDGAGNLGAASSPLTITIDTLAPAAPGGLDLTEASDDGTSNTDNITSDNTPTITGNAEPNSTVELFDGTTSLGTTTTDGSGAWTFTPSSPLLVGTYSVTAIATDAAGNTGAVSTSLPLTITAPPATPFNLDLVDASDTGASNTDELTQDSTPTITGKADPNTTVVVFDGTTELGEVVADASGNWTFTPVSPIADGVHPFTARQKDGAGNLGTAAAPLNITIDSTAPTAPATAPNLVDSSDTGASNTDNVTSDNTPTFNGVAPLDATMVELFAGTTSLGKVPVDGSGNWSLTPATLLADNTYSITVKAIDAAGNTSPASSPLSVTIDALPPKVTFTPLQTNDTTPALTGKIDDPNAVVEVKIGGVTYQATNKGDGTWFIPDNTIAPLAEGGFDILVTARDKQGNSGIDNGGSGTGGIGGATKAVTIDKTAPTGAILAVTPTQAGVNTVAIQFTEPVTNFDVSDLQLTRSADGVETPVSLSGAKLTTADGGKTWALTNIAGVTIAGDYKLTLNRSDIKDLAGNGIAAGAISSFRLGEECVFGTALAVPTLKGKKGTKKTGSGGSNSLSGGKGKDEFKGMNGNDRLSGGGGSDRLDGGQGKDMIIGGTGRDILMGGAGKDKLKGGGGNDMLIGGGGKDLLVGGNGSDILIGGAKKDMLKGGRGKDMFVFSGLASEGNDLIKRFETQRDVIDIRSVFARAEFTGATPDAKYHKYIQTVQVGANTEVRVDLDGAGAGTVFGAIATLKNINASVITCSNFVVA